jgi:hypothetical protein
MSVHNLKPWTELVKLHPDVESGSLADAVFAIDLGAIATGDATTPKVYRDPDASSPRPTFTTDLYKLLEEVLASLAGEGRLQPRPQAPQPVWWREIAHAGVAATQRHAPAQETPTKSPTAGLGRIHGAVSVAVFDGEKSRRPGQGRRRWAESPHDVGLGWRGRLWGRGV